MTSVSQIDQCWYKIINSKFKIESSEVQKHRIFTSMCVECKFLIISNSYQQNLCGSRYCQDCFDKLKTKYYCSVCKEDSSNSIHQRADIFEDKAMIKDLKKTMVECPDCSSQLALIDLEKHVRYDCKNRWIVCTSCNGMCRSYSTHDCKQTPISAAEKDLQYKMCERCGKEYTDDNDHRCNICWKERCPYDCIIGNSTIESHRNEYAFDHLDKIWAIMKEWKISDLKRNEESTEYWLTPIVEKIKKSIEFDSNNVKSLKSDVALTLKEIMEEKEINNIIEMNLNNQMSNVYNTSFDGTIVWRIDNFSQVKEAATKCVQKSIFSPPFYSSRFGYKMCLRLYPSGDTTANEKAMSLFLVLMKGQYDSILKWPFKQKVTFILIDPEFKTNWIDAFIPSDNMTSFARPRTDMNIPSGSSYFIKFDDMNQNTFRYAKDDTMFIKCIVDCSDLNN